MALGGLSAAVGASCLFSVGSALQALDAREAPADHALRVRLLARLARRRRWIAGLLLGALGFPLQVLALAHAPFVVVQPALAAGLVLLLVISTRMLGERPGAPEILGVTGIGMGIALLAWGAPAHSEIVRGEASSISVLGGLAVLSLVPFALRGRRWDLAIVVMVGSALGFAATNIATKFVSDDLTASHHLAVVLWVAVAAALGAGATITEMTALQRLRATTVIPASFALQTFFPVAIEPLYLREHWSTAALAGVPLVAGMALVLAGGLALTRARGVGELVAGG